MNNTQKIDGYYHPSIFTKILSGGLRFMGILFIRSGLCNLSFIGSESYSLGKILLVSGSISFCGLCFLILGWLFYSTKKWVNRGFSLLWTIITCFISNLIFDKLGHFFYQERDHNIHMLMFFLILYVIILSIVRGTKYIKLKKKGKVSGEILNNRANNKKTGYITTVILVLITIISLLYEKIQRSKIPDVDESIFYRSEHQIKLPDEKDALIQSQNTFGYGHTNGYTNNIWKVLDALYSYEERNSNINRENHSNECIILNSGGISYCGTWKWNENTLNRFFNYYTAYTEYDDNEEYFVINNEKVTILEYLDAIEPDMRAELLKLDKTLSMDYYISNDQYLDVLPPYFQSISRASTVALQYYTLKKDWKMVIFIVQLNYKMVDIANHVGGTIYNLISIVIQIIIDDAVNSSITMFPENVRTKLIKQYHEELWDKDNIIHETAKGEYVLWKSAQKDVSILGLEDFNEPSLFHFITHFPFYGKDDTKKLILYSYNMMYNGQYDDYYDFSNKVFINKGFIYNFYGKLIYGGLMPRLTSLESRIDRNIAHKEALITNLQSGDYDMRFGKSDLEADPSSYRKL